MTLSDTDKVFLTLAADIADHPEKYPEGEPLKALRMVLEIVAKLEGAR